MPKQYNTLRRRALALVLAFCLALALYGCGAAYTPDAFDAFVAGLPTQLISASDSAINQLFTDKQAAGFEEALYEWPTYSLDEYKEELAEYEELYRQLTQYDRGALTKSQQLTYDVLESALRDAEHDPGDEAFYYLSNNPLGQYSGVLGDLPLQFYFFELRAKEDVDTYLHLMETLPAFAAEILDFEQERQDKGYGLCPAEIEAVDQMCEDTLAADLSFLTDDFAQKLDAAVFLSDEEKQSYRAEAARLLDEGFLQAFRDVRAGLQALDVKQSGYTPLARMEGGAEYYAYLVETKGGFTDMDEYAQYLTDKTKYAFTKFLSLGQKLPQDTLDGLFDGSLQLYSSSDPNAILQHLQQAMLADFPAAPQVSYQMDILPQAMQQLMPGVGAFYMIGPLDDPNAAQHMMLSGDYVQTDFTTIAHEGYPGHMYQHVYFNSVEHPLVRDLLGFTDYSEGYANYVQRLSAQYADDPEAAQLYEAYDEYLYFLLLQFDYMAHYQGENTLPLIAQALGLSEEDALPVYEQLLFSPGVFIAYYVAGAQFDDLRAEVESALGDSFDPVAFHESILKNGPMPLGLMKQYVRADLLGAV